MRRHAALVWSAPGALAWPSYLECLHSADAPPLMPPCHRCPGHTACHRGSAASCTRAPVTGPAALPLLVRAISRSVLRMQPEPGSHGPQWRPLKRTDSHEADQMVVRAAELARDSHARTRHAAVLVKDGSMLGWGTNGVPYPGEDHCYCKFGELGQ